MTARTFLAAADTGSFAAAAQRINASPPTVTERIKQLEHHLRVRLFERDRRGCRLTAEGKRFVDPARKMVRAWDEGREHVALPAKYSQSVRIGGQHALWPNVLIPWLDTIRGARPGLAIRAFSAAPTQLNRDLERGNLDIAFLYEPLVAKGLRMQRLVVDRLILVTADPARPWRDNFTRLDWGRSVSAQLGALIGDLPNPGLELDLGIASLDWLMSVGASGFVPEQLAQHAIDNGRLVAIADTPTLEFSPYVCWRGSLQKDLTDFLVREAKAQVDRSRAPRATSIPLSPEESLR